LPWPLPAHRLDAATTGLVIFAKTANCRRAFDKLFQKHEIQKTYHAIVHGNVENSNVTTPIKGKSAISEISVIKQINSLKSGSLSLVQLKPLTGREHQLRIHCSSIGNAIVGDKLYGDKNNTITHKGLMLCSTQLEFNHPITSKKLVIGIRIPYKFDTLLQREERRWNKFNS
jgi:23S rRNA-/tRNA-specific pseudouridylate synthase